MLSLAAACGGEESRATAVASLDAAVRDASVPSRGAELDPRAAAVLVAYCEHERYCAVDPEPTLQPCLDREAEQWSRAFKSRKACFEAVLEQLTCYAGSPCGALSKCAPSLQKAMEACLELLRPPSSP